MRPLVVTRNPVSNYIQQVYNNNDPIANGGKGPTTSDPILPSYMLPYGPNVGVANPHYRGIWSATANPAYVADDTVVFEIQPFPIVPVTFLLRSCAGTTAPATFSNGVPTAVANATWQLQSWPRNPVKANVNTATFPNYSAGSGR